MIILLDLDLDKGLPDEADLIVLVLDALDDAVVSRRDLGHQLISEHLADVVILYVVFKHIIEQTYLLDLLALLDEPLLDGGLLGALAQIGQVDPD